MAGMTRVVALRSFFDQGTSRAVTSTEFMEFWKSLTPEEKTEYSQSAAKQLGVELN